MSFWKPFLIVLPYFQMCLLFKINIQKCQTPTGFAGVCRELDDCVGVSGAPNPAGCQLGFVCCPIRGISEEKCYQYTEAVYADNNVAVSLIARDQPATREDECAIVAVPLVVGGEQAILKEFPHMAAIGFGPSPYKALWMCGGSLISEQFVLTAAHCLINTLAGTPKFVKLGVVNVVTDHNMNLQIHEIEKVIIHPRYMSQEKLNDIALLRLAKQVKFSPFVRPACLDFSGQILEHRALATGWGKTHYDNTIGSPDLMKVELDLIKKPDCVKAFKRSLPSGLQDSKICAGVLAGGKDTCQGDSGGPLQTIRQEPYCMYNLIGVTSFGLTCGYAWSPAIYTRVFHYIPWLESIIWPSEQ